MPSPSERLFFQRRFPLRLAWPVSVLLLFAFVTAATSQDSKPKEAEGPGFENLRVLPSDISQQDLMDIMRFDFVGGLGVRCSHCHVGEEGQSLSQYDLASDDKPAKRKAREMLRMVEAINGVHLAGLDDRAEPAVRVSCETCHRGQTQPRMIQEVIHHTVIQDGVEAGVERFRELREEYYGSHTFDFGRTALTAFARTLIAEQRRAEAIRILELNIELYPDYWYTYRMLFELVMEENPERARRELERAIGLAPEGSVAWLRRSLEEFLAGSE
ncbi:MAG: c-type cytochrome [Thermoanaerobaculia bacterium]|nr:c-type cytochrome [Thermoanaerobaculia bacterium]